MPMNWSVEDMLDLMNNRLASDIVFVPGAPPAMWVRGLMQRVGEELLTGEAIGEIFLPIMTASQPVCFFMRSISAADLTSPLPMTGIFTASRDLFTLA
jgi:Tfp pilus assembly ATPase PilU